MLRDTISRRSMLAVAASCAITSAAVARTGADEGVSRDSFTLLEGTEHETTAYVTRTNTDGPTAMVVGGVHGNEVAGYEAAGEIADWTIGAGTLVTIPEANAVAIERASRTDDDGDLNRQFPEGTEPETELARAIWDVVVEYDPDVLIDLHESIGIYAGDPVDGVGQAVFHSDGDGARAAAEGAVDSVNSNYVDDPDLAFQTGTFTGPENEPSGLLVHKTARDIDADTFLVETLSVDVDLETRVRWHLAIVERLVADGLFPEEDPDNGLEPDEPEDDDEADEPEDGDESEDEDEDEEEPDEDDSGEDEPEDEDDDSPDGSPIAKIRTVPEDAEERSLESGESVELDGSCSRAPDGEIVSYEWCVYNGGEFDETEFDEGGETVEATIVNGEHTILLRVTDETGAVDTTEITLSVD